MVNYNKLQYKAAKNLDSVDCECSFCGKGFSKVKRDLRTSLSRNAMNIFCNRHCRDISSKTLVTTNCGQCNKQVSKRSKQISASKSGYVFCNRSCAATYNNTHKTYGYRRSKMEYHLESVIRKTFPTLNLICNDKTAIGSELDFYFPDLLFAIELNGIFHYEPIYGQDKLDKIQNNDNRKLIACYEKGIELAIVDSSSVSHMSVKNKEKFSRIVKELLTLVIKSRVRQQSDLN